MFTEIQDETHLCFCPLSQMKANHQGKPIQHDKRQLQCYEHRLVPGVFPPPLLNSLHYWYNDK